MLLTTESIISDQHLPQGAGPFSPLHPPKKTCTLELQTNKNMYLDQNASNSQWNIQYETMYMYVAVTQVERYRIVENFRGRKLSRISQC